MGGSSGGSSGKVSYPDYMETKHSIWLDEVQALITAGVSGDNPCTGLVAYDTDTDLADNAAKVAAFSSIITAFDPDSDWSDLWEVAQTKLEADVFSDALINEKVATYKANILARLRIDVLPKYQRGMQNVRAVMTSAFTIGEAVLTADAQRDIDNFEAELRHKNENTKIEVVSHATDVMMAAMVQQAELYKSLVHYGVETNRIKIVAKNEENERNLSYDVQDALWDLELYQFGGNALASIAGAAATTLGKGPSKAQSAIGGAMSGAAMGAMTGAKMGSGFGVYGAVIGGVLGGISGLLS